MAQDRQDGWQGIGSAPRDGTRVLVTVRASEQGPAVVDTAYWARGDEHTPDGWRAADSHADCVIAYAEAELVGWMAMPSPRPRTLWPEPMGEPEESGGSGI